MNTEATTTDASVVSDVPKAEAPGTAIATQAPPPAERPPARELSTDTGTINYFHDLRSFEIGQRQAVLLSRTSMLPEQYRHEFWDDSQGKWMVNHNAVGNCFVALELASRLNCSPLVVMQQTDMIYGRPGLRSTFLYALIERSGLFDELEYECNDKEGLEYGYRFSARRIKDGKVLKGTWITRKLVVDSGWEGRKGSKWKVDAELMYRYRAVAVWSRLFASHITMGLQTTDELADVYGEEDRVPRGRVSTEAPTGDPVTGAQRTASKSLEDLESTLTQAGAGAAPQQDEAAASAGAAEGGGEGLELDPAGLFKDQPGGATADQVAAVDANNATARRRANRGKGAAAAAAAGASDAADAEVIRSGDKPAPVAAPLDPSSFNVE